MNSSRLFIFQNFQKSVVIVVTARCDNKLVFACFAVSLHSIYKAVRIVNATAPVSLQIPLEAFRFPNTLKRTTHSILYQHIDAFEHLLIACLDFSVFFGYSTFCAFLVHSMKEYTIRIGNSQVHTSGRFLFRRPRLSP